MDRMFPFGFESHLSFYLVVLCSDAGPARLPDGLCAGRKFVAVVGNAVSGS